MKRALVVGLAVATAGCSSTSGGHHSGATSPSATSTSPSLSPTTTSTAASATVYVNRVNLLCEALLPKILAVTHDGNPAAFTVAQYKAHVAAHAKLEHGFDQQFAAIPVPPSARSAAAAMRAYITFADRLDARRLAAANQGHAAFVAEIRAEDAAYPTSTVKHARDAAGFAPECDAR